MESSSRIYTARLASEVAVYGTDAYATSNQNERKSYRRTDNKSILMIQTQFPKPHLFVYGVAPRPPEYPTWMAGRSSRDHVSI